MLYFFYRALLFILTPLIYLYLYWRLFKGKEDPKRMRERFGHSSKKRPNGEIVWVHGASVGESLSALPLIEKMHQKNPDLYFLLTSGTTTSAQVLKNKKLPPHIIHQFVPIDLPHTVKRFLNFWDPKIAIRIDSELWPMTIQLLQKKHIAHFLVNGKMSARSFQKFLKIPSLKDVLFSPFTTCFAKSDEEMNRFLNLGIQHVETIDNLKLSTPLIQPSKEAILEFNAPLKNRTLWHAASTGKSKKGEAEEPFILEIHTKLKKKHTNILTLLSLRHPNRGDEVIRFIEKAGLTYAQRSKNQKPTENTDIYLLDTMGEMPLFYQACDVCFLGRSLVAWGGNSPVEACQSKCAIIVGKHTESFEELYQDLENKRAILRVNNPQQLYDQVEALFSDKFLRVYYSQSAFNFMKERGNSAELVAKKLQPYLRKTAWLLTDNRTGTANQIRALATYLKDWHIIEHKLHYNWKIKMPNIFHTILGVPSQKDFDGEKPDLILSSGRRTVSTALYLKEQFPKALLVQQLNPNRSLRKFDMILYPEHDKPKDKRITRYFGSFHRFTPEYLKQEKKAWEKIFKNMKSPCIVALVGGKTKKRNFTVDDAKQLATTLRQTKEKLKGSLLITTSRRTGQRQTEILRTEGQPDYFYDVNTTGKNPYSGLLATADLLVVTGESMSMLAEATGAQKPLYVYAPKSLMIPKHQRFVDSLYKKGLAKPFEKQTLKIFKPEKLPNETERIAKLILKKMKK
ncbi:MAG: mitochondrial fission ELM1 family protein [Alphaproteobacteria bacterium]|nr:mitochondrial fission ELM1 family protein [Alphaproteobacteria bacterium]